ncbi:MAG: DUF6653 family protein [Pseudomonadota bacterium]
MATEPTATGTGWSSWFARAMTMDDATWDRHANPWSVWTRVATLPLLLLAIYSAHWIGWWSLAPVAAACLWVWYNPRAFPPPATTDSWAARGTLGERVWLNRANIPIPAHHARAAIVLSVISTLGVPVCIFGLVVADPWAVIAGGTIIYAGKLWFVDRMVWLYQDMQDAHPDYASWLR